MQKSFCLSCKKEVSSKVKKCKCGGTSFAFGEKLEVVNNTVQCSCGGQDLNGCTHMDYTDKYVTSGCCSQCGAPAGIEHYRSKESRMIWGYYDDYIDKLYDKYYKRVKNRQALYEKRKALGRRL